MGTDIHGVFQRRTASGWDDIESTYEQNRHYQLFAVLAGVRNGFGFAGVPTGEAVTPIAEPRGLPVDFAVTDDEHAVSDIAHIDPGRRSYRSEGEPLTVWMGDHSHSWLTGAEMLSWAERAPVVVKTGLVSRPVYEKWDKQGSPESWCGGASGPSVQIVNDNAVEMEQNPSWSHARCHWESSLRDELAYFFDEVARLVSEHGDVRFVFGFDS